MVGMHEFTKDATGLKDSIRRWGKDLGFDAIGFAGIGDPRRRTENLAAWLAAGCHGDMDYMATHTSVRGYKRALPEELVPGTRSIITARMNYRPAAADFSGLPDEGTRACISRYALGRDYHKLLRGRLQRLADRISAEIGEFAYRAFTDSAPVMEVGLAQNSGLGWRGKHTLLLDREAGSYFFPRRAIHRPRPVARCAGHRPLRHLQRLPRCLPDARHRRALAARCAPVHFLPDDRTQGQHPRAPATALGQPHLRLRRLPAGLSVEPRRAPDARTRFRPASRSRPRHAGRTLRLGGR
jgi:hypothetical protein